MAGTRYVSIKKETNFANQEIETTVVHTSQFAESTLDVAGDTAIELNRGFGRSTNHMAKGPYIPQGDITSVLSTTFFPYIVSGLGNYKFSQKTHYFWNTDGKDLPSYQIRVGKDVIEQVFVGCTLNSININCGKEYADFTANYVCANDILNGEAKNIEELNTMNEVPITFSNITIKIDDEDVTSARVLNELSISIENNVDAEGGVGLGSIYTKKMTAGEANTSIDFENLFTDDHFLTMFKEGGSHKLEVIFTDENSYSITFMFPKIYLKNSQQNASGREAIKQPLSFKAMLDAVFIGDDIYYTDCLISIKNVITTSYEF